MCFGLSLPVSDDGDFRTPVVEFDVPLESSGDFELSPDGRIAYVKAAVFEMRVWTPLAWFWPEWTAPLVVSIAVAAAVKLRRRLRMPNSVGQEQCRQCGYQLRGLTADRCPECGTHLTSANRVVGKSRRGMVVRHLALIVGLPVLYGIGLCFGRLDGPECGPYSETLHRWLDRTGLLDRMDHYDGMRPVLEVRGERLAFAVLVIDTNDGSLLRTVRLDRPYDDDPLMLANDGASCFVIDRAGMVEYSTADGAFVRRLSGGPRLSEQLSLGNFFGMGRDGRTAYFGYFRSDDDGNHTIDWHSWDLVADRLPAAAEPEGDRPMFTWSLEYWHRRGLPVPCDDDLPRRGTATSLDGRWFFSTDAPPPAFGLSSWPATSRIGPTRWSDGGGIAVFDVRQGEWAAPLPFPSRVFLWKYRISRDGRRLVASVGSPNPRFGVYDLSRLPSGDP